MVMVAGRYGEARFDPPFLVAFPKPCRLQLDVRFDQRMNTCGNIHSGLRAISRVTRRI